MVCHLPEVEAHLSAVLYQSLNLIALSYSRTDRHF